MLDWWNTFSVGLFDVLLGWLLDWPRPVALVAVGLATAGLLTLVRKWTTNQDRLARAAADLRRLSELTQEAKSSKDHDALGRMRQTKGQISLLKLKAEGWPLFVVIVPLGLLATWAFERLAYHPPRADETVEVVVHLLSGRDPARRATGDVMHLVPQPGLRAPSGWVQSVREDPDPDVFAIWQLQGEARSEPYSLVFRWKEHTVRRELHIGQRTYSPPTVESEDAPPFRFITEVRLRDVRFLGIPGLGAWLPAWLVGYLIVTIPFVLVMKWAMRIY